MGAESVRLLLQRRHCHELPHVLSLLSLLACTGFLPLLGDAIGLDHLPCHRLIKECFAHVGAAPQATPAEPHFDRDLGLVCSLFDAPKRVSSGLLFRLLSAHRQQLG